MPSPLPPSMFLTAPGLNSKPGRGVLYRDAFYRAFRRLLDRENTGEPDGVSERNHSFRMVRFFLVAGESVGKVMAGLGVHQTLGDKGRFGHDAPLTRRRGRMQGAGSWSSLSRTSGQWDCLAVHDGHIFDAQNKSACAGPERFRPARWRSSRNAGRGADRPPAAHRRPEDTGRWLVRDLKREIAVVQQQIPPSPRRPAWASAGRQWCAFSAVGILGGAGMNAGYVAFPPLPPCLDLAVVIGIQLPPARLMADSPENR